MHQNFDVSLKLLNYNYKRQGGPDFKICGSKNFCNNLVRQSCVFFGSVIVVCGPDQFLLKHREPIRVLYRAEYTTESIFEKVFKI